MDKASASDLVSLKFSRLMNATTSPLGMWGDPPLAIGLGAIFLMGHLLALRFEADPRLAYALLCAAAVPIVAAIGIALALSGARDRVVSWLAGLPFPVENMNALLNGLGDEIEVTFAGPAPEATEVNPKLDAVHADCFVTGTNESTMTVRVGVLENKRSPAASNHRRYKRVVELVERALVPVHGEHPITSIRIR